jgi:hypothetical protein
MNIIFGSKDIVNNANRKDLDNLSIALKAVIAKPKVELREVSFDEFKPYMLMMQQRRENSLQTTTSLTLLTASSSTTTTTTTTTSSNNSSMPVVSLSNVSSTNDLKALSLQRITGRDNVATTTPTTTKKSFPSLSLVPERFTLSNFAVNEKETFDYYFMSHISSQLPRWLDAVEIDLIGHLSSKSDAFFAALATLKVHSCLN